MTFLDKLRSNAPTLSCEFFPPKNSGEWSTLYQTMGRMARLQPDFVSVTYGAGGSTREKTVDLVHRIEKELGIEAVAHLTCVGHSEAELTKILGSLKRNGVHSIMALRGDAPKGAERFEAHPEGYHHASDLIELARPDSSLAIGCAYYPEKHLEADSLESDIRYLKVKQDAGADFAVSQIFFDNDSFYNYRDLAARSGVTLPLIAGILPATSRGQVERIVGMSGAKVPVKLQDVLRAAGPEDSLKEQGIEFAIQQSIDLLENGVSGIHLYTFNLSNSSVKIFDALRKRGYFPLAAPEAAAQAA